MGKKAEIKRLRARVDELLAYNNEQVELRRASQAEVARLTKAWEAQHADKVKEKEEAKLWFDEAQKRGTQLATLRAAVDEAIRRAEHWEERPIHDDLVDWTIEPLRNLTKPEADPLVENANG